MEEETQHDLSQRQHEILEYKIRLAVLEDIRKHIDELRNTYFKKLKESSNEIIQKVGCHGG